MVPSSAAASSTQRQATQSATDTPNDATRALNNATHLAAIYPDRNEDYNSQLPGQNHDPRQPPSNPPALTKLSPADAKELLGAALIGGTTALAMLFDQQTLLAATGSITSTFVSGATLGVVDYCSHTFKASEFKENGPIMAKSALYGLILGALAENSTTRSGAITTSVIWGLTALALAGIHINESHRNSEPMPAARTTFEQCAPAIKGASLALGVLVYLAEHNPIALCGTLAGVMLVGGMYGLPHARDRLDNNAPGDNSNANVHPSPSEA